MSAVIRDEPLEFRPMHEADLNHVLSLEHRAYEFPWSRNVFHDCLRVGYSCWVIEQGGVIEAYGIMSVAAGECHILNICVEPQLQGCGIGREVLEFLLDSGKKYGAEAAFLEVRPSNTRARRLYVRAGFNEVGMRRNYYPALNGREDAIIMACQIN